jgi:hypothetical protein
MRIGVSDDPGASYAKHEFAPEAFNGWPLFGGSGPGHVPLAGPHDHTPIEVGIDLTDMVEKLGPDFKGEGRFFLHLDRAQGSKAVGYLHECAVRHYDTEGRFLRETPIEFVGGKFGREPLTVEAVLR